MPTSSISLPERLLLGIGYLDEQHRRLFALLDQLVRAPERDTGSDAFSEVITRISRELEGHFQSEEAFMKSCGLPEANIAAHVEAHSQILYQLAETHLTMMSVLSPDYDSTIRQIAEWIVTHVELFDLTLRRYA